MPQKGGYGTQTEANKKHYLKFTPRNGEAVLFGPVESSKILGYYYDAHADLLRTKGDVDSHSAKETTAKKNFRIFDMAVWEEALAVIQEIDGRIAEVGI